MLLYVKKPFPIDLTLWLAVVIFSMMFLYSLVLLMYPLISMLCRTVQHLGRRVLDAAVGEEM